MRVSFVRIVALAAIAAACADYAVQAQEETRAERYFRDLDRDRDGKIDSDEFNRADERIRERLKQVGFDGRRSITRDELIRVNDKIEELREKERQESRDGGGRPGGGGGPGGGFGPRGVVKKARVTADLSSTFKPFDLDGDGQIGMHEWERSKLAEFRKYDLNGDGVLEPKELMDRPGKPVAKPTAQPLPKKDRETAVAAVAAPTETPPPEDDRLTKQIKKFFKGLDNNDDGSISAEEWADSRGVRKVFEDAGVTVACPMTFDTFSQQYREIEKKKTEAAEQQKAAG